MFFDGNIFWLLMGMSAVLIGAGLNTFAKDRGWVLSWWKWVLSIVWYTLFTIGFYAWGTLIGESEGAAGFKFLLATLLVCAILGVGLWRLLALKPKNA